MSKFIKFSGPHNLFNENEILSCKIVLIDDNGNETIISELLENNIYLFDNLFKYETNYLHSFIKNSKIAIINQEFEVKFENLRENLNRFRIYNNTLRIDCKGLNILKKDDVGLVKHFYDYRNGYFEYTINEKSLKKFERFLIKLSKD